jgi:aminopeptidase N
VIKPKEEVKERVCSTSWVDAKHDQVRALTKTEAEARFKIISEVSYKLAFALVAGAKSFFGHTSVDFKLSEINEDVFFDFKGLAVHGLIVNGTRVEVKDFPDLFNSHKLKMPTKYLKVGQNHIEVSYQGEYVSDCQGMHKYVDPEDNTEYIYTDSEPFYAHLWFPCFDQPDLKAPYELVVLATEGWTVISNAAGKMCDDPKPAMKDFNVTKEMTDSFNGGAYKVF